MIRIRILLACVLFGLAAGQQYDFQDLEDHRVNGYSYNVPTGNVFSYNAFEVNTQIPEVKPYIVAREPSSTTKPLGLYYEEPEISVTKFEEYETNHLPLSHVGSPLPGSFIVTALTSPNHPTTSVSDLKNSLPPVYTPVTLTESAPSAAAIRDAQFEAIFKRLIFERQNSAQPSLFYRKEYKQRRF